MDSLRKMIGKTRARGRRARAGSVRCGRRRPDRTCRAHRVSFWCERGTRQHTAGPAATHGTPGPVAGGAGRRRHGRQAGAPSRVAYGMRRAREPAWGAAAAAGNLAPACAAAPQPVAGRATTGATGVRLAQAAAVVCRSAETDPLFRRRGGRPAGLLRGPAAGGLARAARSGLQGAR